MKDSKLLLVALLLLAACSNTPAHRNAGADDAGADDAGTCASANCDTFGHDADLSTVGDADAFLDAWDRSDAHAVSDAGAQDLDGSPSSPDAMTHDSGPDGSDAGADGPWQPAPGTTWQWQLQGTIDTSVDAQMYDIDLFDTPQHVIDTLHADGRVVICYFSAGTYEDWRPDKDRFNASDYGNALPDWPGEYWLDVRSQNVRTIMQSRLDLATSKDCDGVEPDNVDGVTNNPGFDFTRQDQIDYDRFLATQAHARGLSVGLKNALEFIPELQSDFDWALNEECLSYDECDALLPFIQAGKAVFHTEYVDAKSNGPTKRAQVCAASPAGFSTLIKTWDLDAWRLTCP